MIAPVMADHVQSILDTLPPDPYREQSKTRKRFARGTPHAVKVRCALFFSSRPLRPLWCSRPPANTSPLLPPSLYGRALHAPTASIFLWEAGCGCWHPLPWPACLVHPSCASLDLVHWIFFALIVHSDGASSAPSCQRRALPMSCNLTLACLLWHVSVARYRRGCDACGTGKRPRT